MHADRQVGLCFFRMQQKTDLWWRDPFDVCESSEGSDEFVHLHRYIWSFLAYLGELYQNLRDQQGRLYWRYVYLHSHSILDLYCFGSNQEQQLQHHRSYCSVSQEWQLRNFLFTMLSGT